MYAHVFTMSMVSNQCLVNQLNQIPHSLTAQRQLIMKESKPEKKKINLKPPKNKQPLKLWLKPLRTRKSKTLLIQWQN